MQELKAGAEPAPNLSPPARTALDLAGARTEGEAEPPDRLHEAEV